MIKKIVLTICVLLVVGGMDDISFAVLCQFPADCPLYCTTTCEPVSIDAYWTVWIDYTGKIWYPLWQKQFDCNFTAYCYCKVPGPGTQAMTETLDEAIKECKEIEKLNKYYLENYIYCSTTLPLPSFCPFGGASGSFDQIGRNFFSKTLISLPSHGLTPSFEIHYNSQYDIDRGIGVGWSHTYLYTLSVVHNDNVIITTDKGLRRLYIWNQEQGIYQSTSDDHTVLTKDGSTFIATAPDGIEYTYESGKLTNIRNPNNNTLALFYTNGNLERVEDSFGRILTFSYNGSKLQSVTDPNQNTYSFEYDQHDNLVAITYPDTTKQKFEYYDPYDSNNLTHVIDNYGNIVAQYQYDDSDRLINESTADGSDLITIGFEAGTNIFSDDFENWIKTEAEWTTTGTIEQTFNPETNSHVAHINPGSMTYAQQAPAADVLKVTCNLWVDEENDGDFWVKIYDSSHTGDEYGLSIRFAITDTIKSEFIYEESAQELSVTSFTRGKWYKLEIEAYAEEINPYFKLWLDCKYIGAYPFKRVTDKLDKISIQASASGCHIMIDNFSLAEIAKNESTRTITDSRGNTTVLTIIPQNDFGGTSYRLEGGCASCSQSSTNMLYEYDSRWNLRKTTDGNDVITEMTYDDDDRGLMLEKIEAKGTALQRKTTYTYHPTLNKVATITVPSVDTLGQNYNKVTTYEYYDDGTGNLHYEIVTGYSNGTPFSYTTSYTYNTHGQLTVIDGPRIDVTDVITNTYHSTYSYLTSTSYPNGTVTYDVYDANHNVGTITDMNNVVTTYTYDYANRVKTITIGSAVTTYAYDAAGNIDYVDMPAGNRIDYEYDTSNRVIKITDALGNYIYYEYDGEGNKTKEEIHDGDDVLKKYLNFEYDQFNRLEKIKNPDNSFTKFAYDNNGNRTKMTDPEEGVTDYAYDALNRVTTVTQAKGTTDQAVTGYTYDSQDNLIQVEDAEGKITDYKYDDMGRLIRTDSPDTGTTYYTYDPAGNLTTKTDAKSIETNYTYDALNRLLTIDFPNDQDITYTYDEVANPPIYGKGRITTVVDASGTTKYVYDPRGNTKEQKCTINSQDYITQYDYNLNNNITKITYPRNNIIVEYGLNAIGNITTVTVNQSTILVSALAYEPFGDFASMNFDQNSITTTITHNSRYGIDRIQSGTTIVDRQYTHDFNGNITYIKQNDTLPSMPDLATRTDTYAYVTESDLISKVTEGSTEYDYTYDANGNITNDDRHTYVYNEQNQLYRVMDGQTILGEYTYNAKGQRVKKVAGGTTIYHYNIMGNLIQETDASGNVIASYVYAGMNRLAMVKPDGSIFYYHNDHLGTPLAMTDEGGNIVWKAAYDPFGKAEVDPSSTVTNNFRFPGQYYDSESGLHYNWFRYYDPGTGRYVTADPVGLLGGINLYIYALNNPNKYGDYFGLASEDNECCYETDKCYKCTKWGPKVLNMDCFCSCLAKNSDKIAEGAIFGAICILSPNPFLKGSGFIFEGLVAHWIYANCYLPCKECPMARVKY